jgi:hypothetical protein
VVGQARRERAAFAYTPGIALGARAPTELRTLFLLALLLINLAMPSVEVLVLVDAPEGAAGGDGSEV